MSVVGPWLIATALIGQHHLQFETTEVDLGRKVTVGTIEQSFSFQVKGGSAHIDELLPSCGCLKPTLGKRSYESGETGSIDLAIHATSQTRGDKSYELTIRLRDPKPRQVTLKLDVELQSDVKVSPSNLLMHVNGSRDIRQTIRVRDGRKTPLMLTDVASSAEWLKPTILEQEKYSRTSPVTRAIAVVVTSDVPVGRHEEVIRVHTDDEDYGSFEIPVTVHRRAIVQAFPEQVRFPATNAVSQWTEVRLRHAKSRQIEIDRVELMPEVEGLSVTWQKLPGRFPWVRLKRSGKAQGDNIQARVWLKDPEGTELSIPVETP